MRTLPVLLALTIPALAFAQPAVPDLLWQHQGVEDINAFAWLPDVDGDGVPDIAIETYDAGAAGDHLLLVSGGSTGVPTVIWSARPSSGASSMAWDGTGFGGRSLSSGCYLMRVRTAGEQWTVKAVLVR